MPKTVIVWKILELAKALYPEIERMWYMIDKETHEEYVSVPITQPSIIRPPVQIEIFTNPSESM